LKPLSDRFCVHVHISLGTPFDFRQGGGL
jgi:hypothetical protein